MTKKIKILLEDDSNFKLFLLLIFSVLISIVEALGVSVIMPFISLSNDFTLIESNEYYNYAYNFFKFTEYSDFVVFFGILLVLFYIARAGLNLLYTYCVAAFTLGRYKIISKRLFENYLNRSYCDHVNMRSSELTKTIVNETQYLVYIFSSTLLIISEFFVILLIYSLFLFINWKITLLLTTILGLNGVFLFLIVSKRIKKEGKIREKYQKAFFETINTTFSNFKLIKLTDAGSKIKSEFSRSVEGFSNSNVINQTLSNFPRLFLEALSFSIVVVIIIYFIVTYDRNISEVMSLISVFILGLYRLMPSINRIITAYNDILFYSMSLDIITKNLNHQIEKLGNKGVSFKSEILIQNLSFEYLENKVILDKINLNIKYGEKIAFVGKSGSGKSTLVDIIMGLQKPKNGKLLVDNILIDDSNIKSWRIKIGYIPQSIYLFDGTVAENIAFGLKIDSEQVRKSLKQANLLDFLEEYHNGIETKVGENGMMLSGGQKQRIAIARALYSNPDILVLDEATSALDNEIEKIIMEEIYNISENKTLIIIAHRLSTIERCDKIYKLEHGMISTQV